MRSVFHEHPLLCCPTTEHRRQSWGFGGRDPPNFWKGSWTGRKLLLYLIMYRKYVRKWRLLKRNRIICSEIAVNSQFLPGKSEFFVKLPKKSKFFGNVP